VLLAKVFLGVQNGWVPHARKSNFFVFVERNIAALVWFSVDTTDKHSANQNHRKDNQQSTLEELHIGRRGHAGSSHNGDNNGANHYHANVVGQAKQWLYQNSCPNHLGDQVENGNNQSTDGGCQLDTFVIKLGIQGIGKGVFTQTLHGFGNHKQGYNPTSQITDGVQKAIVTHGGDHAANTQEGGC